ncbi:hypothetical protein [Streptomyces sp. NPDC052127]|uniref:hypothetical protein n=1 Tax=Streptomyces sp. NPDC052127 TaxID=3155679 RepID=UPI003425BAC4
MQIAGRHLELGPVFVSHPEAAVAADSRGPALAALTTGRGDSVEVGVRPVGGGRFRLVLQNSPSGSGMAPVPPGLPGYREPAGSVSPASARRASFPGGPRPAGLLQAAARDGSGSLHIRRIPPALPLPSGIEHGLGAEAAAHTAAATWGLPDFVFQQAEHASKGSGRRELGDRLLLAGRRGAVVQVKARTITPKPDVQEKAWIQKVAAKAMSQAKGTVRQLRMLPADMVNGRGRTLHVAGDAYEWIAVFLLDHPRVPDGAQVAWTPIGMPAIALTRRDWDFLFDQLRSTTAVLDYLFRAAATPGIPLNDEPVRYYEFAAADAAAPPGEIDTDLVGLGGQLHSTPLLPQAPAASAGTRAHLVIRMVMEDITLSALPDHAGEADRQAVLADLDSLPVGDREVWGQLLLDMLDDVVQVPDGDIKWRFRRHLNAQGTRQTVYACATRFDESVQAAFGGYVQLRHHEVGQRTGRGDDLVTTGVMLTPNYGGRRPWDTTMARTWGSSQLTEDDLAGLNRLWNRQQQPDGA